MDRGEFLNSPSLSRARARALFALESFIDDIIYGVDQRVKEQGLKSELHAKVISTGAITADLDLEVDGDRFEITVSYIPK